jgi:hypothetical protein
VRPGARARLLDMLENRPALRILARPALPDDPAAPQDLSITVLR